jgi:hypothetical protein
MKFLLLGKYQDQVSVLCCSINEFTSDEIAKYIKHVLLQHVNKTEFHEIMSNINNIEYKGQYRVTYDVDKIKYCIIKAEPGIIYGTHKSILAEIWVDVHEKTITPKMLVEQKY